MPKPLNLDTLDTPFGKEFRETDGMASGGCFPASSGSSDYEGVVTLPGDIDVSGAKPIMGGPTIGEAPKNLFDYVSEISKDA